MGKRSDFKRKARDNYPTPDHAIAPLLPFLKRVKFCEPCAGDGRMRDYLVKHGHRCIEAWDIHPRGKGIKTRDAMKARAKGVGAYITNPPWSRDVLHPIIENLGAHKPTFLLFDADWLHTRQARPYWPRCALVVSVGRVKWIKNSPHVGKDNACWYLFVPGHTRGPQFFGRS